MNGTAASKVANRPVAVYIVAAIGFLFFGLMAHDFPPYLYFCAALVLLCFVQAYYQFFAVWLGFLGLYMAGAGFYGWVLVTDLIKLARDQRATALLDFDDSAVFVAFVALMLGVTIWLLRARPRQSRHTSDV